MKATLSIPNYPAFWNTATAKYSQDEIDLAIEQHEAQKTAFGLQPNFAFPFEVKLISTGNPGINFDEELLASWGSSPTHISQNEMVASMALSQMRDAYLRNVRNILEANQGNFQSEPGRVAQN